jgi:hypothetical protein
VQVQAVRRGQGFDLSTPISERPQQRPQQ